MRADQQIGAHVRRSDDAKRAAKITGIGEIGASALIAGEGDFKQFNLETAVDRLHPLVRPHEH